MISRIKSLQVLSYSLTVLLLLAAAALAQTASAQAAAQTESLSSTVSTPLTVGTRIPIVATGHLSSSSAVKGQSIEFRVFRDVSSGQSVVIPAGSKAMGRILEVHSAGAFGKAGSLVVSCDSILLPDGTIVPVKIDDSMTVSGRDASGAAGLSGFIVGAVVGVLVYDGTSFVNNGLFTSGKHYQSSSIAAGLASGLASGLLVAAIQRGGDANISTGQQFDVVLTQDMPLHTASTQASTAASVDPPH